MIKERHYRIGEVYWMRFDGVGSEQKGLRPGVVFQNNLGNSFSPNIIALPMTSNLRKASQITHVKIKAEDSGLPKDSLVLCENPERMSKDRIGSFITTLSEKDIGKIAAANLVATSAISFIDEAALIGVWKIAMQLNDFR